jgi:hypothetical protein
LEYLDLSRKRKLLSQIYPLSSASDKAVAGKAVKEMRWPTKRTFNVPDYQVFSDMATFFNEVSQIIRFAPAGGGNYKVSFYDPEQSKDFSFPPLFLIDGKATYDGNFIGHLHPSIISTVEILHGAKLLKKAYGLLGAGGVIRITTLGGKQNLPSSFEQDIFNMSGKAVPLELPKRNAPQNPFLTPLLYWSPSVQTDAKGVGAFQASPSDDSSEFCIHVIAQSKDGRRGEARHCYQAKPGR